MKKWLKAFIAYTLASWAIGLLSFLPSYFFIYEPFVNGDWTKSECIVQQIHTYSIFLGKDKYGRDVIHTYTRMDVATRVEDKWIKGFACGVTNPHLLSSTMSMGVLPYQTERCPRPDICGGEEFLPTWLCNDCQICDQFLSGKLEVCLYSPNPEGGIKNLRDLPHSFDIEYPVAEGTYLRVVLGDEIYYSYGEFIAMNVCTGLLFGGPFLAAFVVAAIFCVEKIRKPASYQPSNIGSDT